MKNSNKGAPQMRKRIMLRSLRMITLLVALVALTFILVSFSPIDPVKAYVGGAGAATDAQVAALRAKWGMDLNLLGRLWKWIIAIASGDLGQSFIYQAPVAQVIGRAFMNSLMLMMLSWISAGILGYALGVLCAFKSGRTLDRAIRWYAYTIASTPTYVVGLIMLVIFGVWLSWAPVGLSTPVGVLDADITIWDRLGHFVLPWLTLTMVSLANAIMHSREATNQVLASDYVLFAKARGMGSWQIWRTHGWRNTILPVLMLQFSYFSELFGGSALAEVVFSYHGLGSTMTQAGLRSDLPLLLGCVLCCALFVFFGNLVADILALLVDPRLRRSANAKI